MLHHLSRIVAVAVLAVIGLDLARGGASTGAAPAAPPPRTSTGTIAFVCEHDDGKNDELCVMDADGTHRTRLTDSPGPDRAPSWDADGDQLVFNSRRGDHPDRPQIYRLDLSTGAVARVSVGPWEDQRASWAPDGRSVTYQRGTFASGYQIQRQDLATGAVVALTAEPGIVNAAGSLDPSGTRLLHQSNRAATGLFPFGTYVTDVEAGTMIRLAGSVTASHDGPRWSPAGDRVAVAAGGSLYVIDVASGSVDQVTDGAADDSAPAWSPDGGSLAFQSDRLDPDLDDDVDVTSIHVLDLASGAIADLGAGRTPAWSPLDRTPIPAPASTTTAPPSTTTGVVDGPPAPAAVGAVPRRASGARPVAGRPAYAG